MPKVTFVNEHREVEVEAGRRISDIAKELGIAVCREEFSGTGIGDYTVWVKGDEGCVSGLTWYEKWIKRCKGWRRMANRTRVLADVEIWTQQGVGSRLRVSRPIAEPERAGDDPLIERFDHENNAAATAWNPTGHPKAVGMGTREAPVYVPPVKKKKKAAKKAKPAPAESASGEAKPADENADADDSAQS